MDGLKELAKKLIAVKKLTIDDDLLDYAISEVKQSVLNYCNLVRIPKELYYVVASMIVAVATDYHAIDPDADKKEAKTIKVGDTTIELTAVKTTSAVDANMAKVLFDYEHQLNNFRKVKW